MVQVFDVISDEEERHNLAPGNSSLVAELMKTVVHFNDSIYVDSLFYKFPTQPIDGTECPRKTNGQPLTPCDIRD
jgi:hypothetical protein